MALNPLTEQINKIKARLAQQASEPPVFDTGEQVPFDPGEPPPAAPYNFNLIKTEPPPSSQRKRPSVDAVRDMMRAEMIAYLRNPDPDHMLLIRATPGVGKTTAAAWAALEMAKIGKKIQ